LGLDVSRRFREYSRGNKQKVGVVQALMHRPRLLILDEPTSGLDPLNQQAFYALLVEAHQRGSTIFLSSHIIPEVERICRQVGIIRAGKLVNVAEVAALKQLRQQVITLTFGESPSADWFSLLPGVEVTAIEGLEMQLSVRGDLQSVLGAAAAHHVNQINTRQTSLEEIFLQYYAKDAG
jgi:ABC-2 type transport system ATP-binding protein